MIKTRAAIAWKAGAPLTIDEVDLEGPRAGEVLVEVKATRICHTDWYALVVPGIALAKVRPDAPFDVICYIGCGITTGVGAVLFTAKVEAGANVAVFGLGGIGLNVIQGARMVGTDKIIGIDININPARQAMPTKFGMTHVINPADPPNVVDAIQQFTDGGADYSFEWIGNTQVMRQALECTAGAAASSSAWPAQAMRFLPARSCASPAASGNAPPSVARGAAAMCPRSSTGTWTASSTLTT